MEAGDIERGFLFSFLGIYCQGELCVWLSGIGCLGFGIPCEIADEDGFVHRCLCSIILLISDLRTRMFRQTCDTGMLNFFRYSRKVFLDTPRMSHAFCMVMNSSSYPGLSSSSSLSSAVATRCHCSNGSVT